MEQTDITDTQELSKRIKEELVKLEKKGNHPRTMIRGGAVAAFLNKEGTSKEIAERQEEDIREYQVVYWTKAFTEGGFDALERMENVPFTRTEPDIENDIKLSEELQKELEVLEKEGTHPLTIIRGGAAAAFLNQEGTSIEIAESRKIEPYNVTSWASVYRNGGGIEALKRMEKRPIKAESKVNIEKDKELSQYLKLRLPSLDPTKHPNTIIRVKTVIDVLGHMLTRNQIMAKHKVTRNNLASWTKRFMDGGGYQSLCRMENIPVKRNTTHTQASNELAKKLLVELETYKKTGGSSDIIEMGTGVAAYMNGEGSAIAIGKSIKVGKKTMLRFKNIYIDKGIEDLKEAIIEKLKRDMKKSSQPTEVSTTTKSPQKAVKESAVEHRKVSSDFYLSKLAKTPENPNRQNPYSRKRKIEKSLDNNTTRIIH